MRGWLNMLIMRIIVFLHRFTIPPKTYHYQLSMSSFKWFTRTYFQRWHPSSLFMGTNISTCRSCLRLVEVNWCQWHLYDQRAMQREVTFHLAEIYHLLTLQARYTVINGTLFMCVGGMEIQHEKWYETTPTLLWYWKRSEERWLVVTVGLKFSFYVLVVDREKSFSPKLHSVKRLLFM